MGVFPYYTIHRYRDDFFKVVAFNGVRDSDFVIHREKDNCKENDEKLSSNISRARSMVLQYALCNPWDFFFTGTLDKFKFDRYNLDAYASRLSQFIRDMRKKYQAKFQVLLVPEMHKDGAWHMHGLIYGLPLSVLAAFEPPAPVRLIEGGFLNWPDYQSKFGFCSLAPVRDLVATAFYITKYVSKDIHNRKSDLGKHLYFHSRPLNKAVKASDVYLPSPELDSVCTEHYKFCSTGLVENAPWYYPYQFDGSVELDVDLTFLSEAVPVSDPLAGFKPWEIDSDYLQLSLDEFTSDKHLEALK